MQKLKKLIPLNYLELNQLKMEILNDLPYYDESLIELKIHDKISALESLNLDEKRISIKKLADMIFKYDVIQPLLDDPDISEIMINGPKRIFVEKKGKIELTDVVFENAEHLMTLVQKIALEVDRSINLLSPILDAHLKDGSRVNVVLMPIAKDGPVVTIRKFGDTINSMDALVSLNMIDCMTSDFLIKLIQSKYNIFICGGTGTGKTTLLNCLSSAIDKNERIITIEDSRELNLPAHENIISLETRENQSSEKISISLLIKTALRMRPNRIIVGEVRGEEVIDMLQAMNTGHDGSMSTGHGNTPIDMLLRIESIASSHSHLDSQLIKKQIISAIDFLIFIERLPNGERVITQVSEIIKNTNDYQLYSHYDYFNSIECDIENIKCKRKWLKNGHT